MKNQGHYRETAHKMQDKQRLLRGLPLPGAEKEVLFAGMFPFRTRSRRPSGTGKAFCERITGFLQILSGLAAARHADPYFTGPPGKRRPGQGRFCLLSAAYRHPDSDRRYFTACRNGKIPARRQEAALPLRLWAGVKSSPVCKAQTGPDHFCIYSAAASSSVGAILFSVIRSTMLSPGT